MLRKKWDSKHFLSKNPTSFSFEEHWENSFFPNFLKILEKCLNSIETSSLDSVHPWAHSQILFIIFREFSSSSGCFFQDVPIEAESAILNLTIWRRSRFRETCSSLCRGSNGNCRKKGNRQPDRKLWMGCLRNQNQLILLWWFQPFGELWELCHLHHWWELQEFRR